MKIFDYLFFGIFNSYYKDGNYKNDIPWLTAMSIFAAMFFLNITSILDLFSNREGYPVSKSMGYVIGVTGVLLSYVLFVSGKRYEIIYKTFSILDRKQRLKNKIAAWFYVLMSIVIAILPPLKQVLDK